MEITVVHARSGKTLVTLTDLFESSTISDVKRQYYQRNPKYYPDRQSFRSEAKGRSLKDDVTLGSLDLEPGSKLYFKDLGPQVSWTTVFLCEYAGPLFIYLLFYIRPALVYGAEASAKPRHAVVEPAIVYGAEAAAKPRHAVVDIAALCWTLHYSKRLFETVFVHRFSHATMPIMNIFKNSTYYWGFAAYVAYYVNHPLYTPPSLGDIQVYGGLAAFLISEFGNLSIHLSLRSLRPPGTKERRIPYPGMNPMTQLFSFVSCPNYTYEVCAWIAFSFMTQCLPALLFTLAGFYQMTVWALGKHRNYKREFTQYPRGRKSIIPFLI